MDFIAEYAEWKNNIDNIKRLINFIFIILYNLYTMFSSISSESTGMNHTRPQSRSENAQKVTNRMTNSWERILWQLWPYQKNIHLAI